MFNTSALIRHKNLVAAAAAALAFAASGVASADTVNGQIDVTLTLGSGCVIDGNGATAGTSNIDFGTIDFGSQPAQFQKVSASLTGTAGSGVLVQCSAGNAPVLTFDGGLHYGNAPSASTRSMQHATDTTKFVGYRLYSDSALSAEISNGGTVTLPLTDGTAQLVSVWAEAYGDASLIDGVYRDTVGVTLDF